jgi:hypothetical protein
MADMIADDDVSARSERSEPRSVNNGDPASQTAMRRVRILLRCYLGLSLLTLVASAVLRDHQSIVTPAVWVRGTIVALTALLMTVFAARAAGGSHRAYLRLRIVTGIAVVAIIAVLASAGTFPTWLKVEQGLCGALLLGAVVLLNGRTLRTALASGSRSVAR